MIEGCMISLELVQRGCMLVQLILFRINTVVVCVGLLVNADKQWYRSLHVHMYLFNKWSKFLQFYCHLYCQDRGHVVMPGSGVTE